MCMQHVELSTAQRPSQRAIGEQALRLVDDDEFDVGNVSKQFCFDLADDPGELGLAATRAASVRTTGST